MKDKVVLVIGATGLLGKDVFNYFSKQKGFLVYGTYSANTDPNFWKLDVTSEMSIRHIFMHLKPDMVINCSALSNVDLCEKDHNLAYKINVKGLENLINYSHGKKFVHISTDYVFDGKKGNYKEDDKKNPINYYAETKAIGEELLEKSDLDHVTARVAILYGTGRKNFVTSAMESLGNKKAVQVVRGQLISPTYTPDIAKALHKLLPHKGVFHVVGDSQISREEMVDIIRRDLKANKGLVKVIDKVESWTAERPKNTTLCIDKIKRLGIRMNTFNKGYKKLKREME